MKWTLAGIFVFGAFASIPSASSSLFERLWFRHTFSELFEEGSACRLSGKIQLCFEMSAGHFRDLLHKTVLRSPVAKYAALAALGTIAAASFPGVVLRTPEVWLQLTQSPLRSFIELSGIAGAFGSVIAQSFGSNVNAKALSHLERLIPSSTKYLAKLSPAHSLILRLLVGSAFSYSWSRGLNPSPQQDLLDMTGRVALVTGATSGIGYETARALVSRGCKVILVARDEQKGALYATKLRAEASGAQVEVLLAAQEDLHAVASLMPQLVKELPQGLDVLVLNAGYAPASNKPAGPSGFESSITAMHFAHFLLAKMVWPHLNKNARVVVTASAAHTAIKTVDDVFAGIEPNTAPINDGGKLYARSKFANALFARQLGRLADKDSRRIRVTSHHPGAVATSIWAGINSRVLANLLDFISTFTMRTNYQGAATLIDAALGRAPLRGQPEAPNGAYYTSSTIVNTQPFFNPVINDPVAALDFWNRSEAVIKPFEPTGLHWNLTQ